MLVFDPLALGTSVLSTLSCLFYYYVPEHWGHSEISYPVSWSVASFVVIFPVTFTINQSFARRERGNNCLAQIKSLIVHVYLAHSIWDWDKSKNGRRNMPSAHAQGVKHILLTQVEILTDCLNLPPICPTRTHDGESFSFEKKDEFEVRVEQRRKALARMMSCVRQLGCCVELLKYHGLPANEASRANQYSHMVQTDINEVLQLKDFRTPLRIRAFVQIYLCLLPIFYGPNYAHMAKHGTNLPFAICFSIFISMALVGLFNVQIGLEDPFRGGTDGIDVNIWRLDVIQRLDAVSEPVQLSWDNRTWPSTDGRLSGGAMEEGLPSDAVVADLYLQGRDAGSAGSAGGLPSRSIRSLSDADNNGNMSLPLHMATGASGSRGLRCRTPPRSPKVE
jgi:hypothetical protein